MSYIYVLYIYREREDKHTYIYVNSLLTAWRDFPAGDLSLIYIFKIIYIRR